MDEVKRKRQAMQRGAAVEDVVESVQTETDDIESIAVVVVYKDGSIQSAMSCDSTLELLGMADCLKDDVMKLIDGEYTE